MLASVFLESWCLDYGVCRNSDSVDRISTSIALKVTSGVSGNITVGQAF